jgi:hypothetical protein
LVIDYAQMSGSEGVEVLRDDCRSVDYPWDQFDPEAYLASNYSVVREEDRQILEFVRDFLRRELAADGTRTGRRGIDVGTGANLYPALAMLPFCDEITLYEHSKSNLDWLAGQCAAQWPSWDRAWAGFWDVLGEREPYARFAEDPHVELGRCVEVVPGSVFDLDARAGLWEVGTMFFVAESITTRWSEFAAAVNRFLDVLVPGSPFAIAFMENSIGYQVGAEAFPAVPIGLDDVARCLARRAPGTALRRIAPCAVPLRHGYSGMILACGRAGSPAVARPP